MDKGVYCLIFRSLGGEIKAGALGTLVTQAGWLVYTGSAQGTGGLLRVRRHIRFSRSGKTPRWHVDYLHSSSIHLVSAICASTAEPLECPLAGLVSILPEALAVPRFGSSDCRCRSHLWFFRNDPAPGVFSCFLALGLSPRITRINTMNVQD
jgi:Uri superfamily endonuclease